MRRISKELIPALAREAEGQKVEKLQLDKLTQSVYKAADEKFEEQKLMSEDTEHFYYDKYEDRWKEIYWWSEAKERELRNEELFLGLTRNNIKIR